MQSRDQGAGRFPFDEILENFGWKSNGTGSFPEKIFENLGQPFQCSRKVKISVFSKFSCSIQKFPVGLFEHIR